MEYYEEDHWEDDEGDATFTDPDEIVKEEPKLPVSDDGLRRSDPNVLDRDHGECRIIDEIGLGEAWTRVIDFWMDHMEVKPITVVFTDKGPEGILGETFIGRFVVIYMEEIFERCIQNMHRTGFVMKANVWGSLNWVLIHELNHVLGEEDCDKCDADADVRWYGSPEPPEVNTSPWLTRKFIENKDRIGSEQFALMKEGTVWHHKGVKMFTFTEALGELKRVKGK